MYVSKISTACPRQRGTLLITHNQYLLLRHSLSMEEERKKINFYFGAYCKVVNSAHLWHIISKSNFSQEAYLPVKKNETRERLILCINATLQKKAKEIVVLNLKEISAFTDYMIICSGTSEREVQAIAQAIQLFLKKAEIKPMGIEGEANGQWVLLDYDDVVISVFYEPVRTFYNIENLWDAPRMNIDENKKEIKRLNKEMA